MTTKALFIATALMSVLSATSTGALFAEELDSTRIMKPLHGISFDVGSKRAVSYFLSENGHCKLVLTIADPPKWDDISTFTATRFEAAIPGGKATRFNSTESKSHEFACHISAQSMSVTPVTRVGFGAPVGLAETWAESRP
jgi:hypothetical protein